MQLLPGMLLNTDRLHPLFRNSRQVAFHFDIAQPIDSARNLLRVMGNGFVSVIFSLLQNYVHEKNKLIFD